MGWGRYRSKIRDVVVIMSCLFFSDAGAHAWTGIYTDRPNYAQGETISIHASAQQETHQSKKDMEHAVVKKHLHDASKAAEDNHSSAAFLFRCHFLIKEGWRQITLSDLRSETTKEPKGHN